MIYLDWKLVISMPLRIPNKLCNKILLTKHLVAQPFEVRHLIIIDRNKDEAIVRQQVTRQFKARVHHIEPIGMIAALGFRIGRELLAFFVDLARPFKIGLEALLVVVRVDEVLAGVIRGIDIDHLDLRVVVLLQDLEHLKVVTLDEDVLGGVPVFRVLEVRFQRRGRRLLRGTERTLLARPEEAEALAAVGRVTV